jgi:hypothetical protein
MNLTISSIEQRDDESCGRIGYEAHKAISSALGYPSEQPSKEYGIGLIKMLLGNPNSRNYVLTSVNIVFCAMQAIVTVSLNYYRVLQLE